MLFMKHQVHLAEMRTTAETWAQSIAWEIWAEHDPTASPAQPESPLLRQSAQDSRAWEQGTQTTEGLKQLFALEGKQKEITAQINKHSKDNNEISPVAAHVHSASFFFFCLKCLSLAKAIKHHGELVIFFFSSIEELKRGRKGKHAREKRRERKSEVKLKGRESEMDQIIQN